MKLEQARQWSELVASVAVAVTLVLLVTEVRANTLALERQATMERTAAFGAPFLDDTVLASIVGKIKTVDGPDRLPAAFVEQYSLTYEEATIWERHLWILWSSLEGDFLVLVEADEVTKLIGILKSNPDNKTYLEYELGRHSAEFADYVRRVPAVE